MAVSLRDASEDDLAWVERAVCRCARAMAEFGGFYGAATTKLAPLLGPDRHLFVIEEDGTRLGFVDVNHDVAAGYVGLAYFVVGSDRRRGVATRALTQVAAMYPEGILKVAIGPDNHASLAAARAAGFAATGTNEWDETVLCRTPSPGEPGAGTIDGG